MIDATTGGPERCGAVINRVRRKSVTHVSGMDLKRLVTPIGFEPMTCGLEVRCSIQLSYGACQKPETLMRPSLFAIEFEIFRIGSRANLASFLIGKLIGNTVSLGIGDSFVPA